MLSVLIPIYNADVSNLVAQLHSQLSQTGIVFEIICIDDASTLRYEENINLNHYKWLQYNKLTKNVGRAAIRNKLAETARFESLLFIDSDMLIQNTHYIEEYLKYLPEYDVIYGGLSYATSLENSNYKLRWEYGRKKEAITADLRAKDKFLSVKTCNLLIKRELFLKIKFNEDIKQYGHEDTLFCIELEKHNVKVLHIDNTLLHEGLEDATTYLHKVNTACISLQFIAQHFLSKEEKNKIKLIYFYDRLDKMGLMGILSFVYKLFETKINRNLTSSKPSMLLLDYYKLMCYHRIAKN